MLVASCCLASVGHLDAIQYVPSLGALSVSDLTDSFIHPGRTVPEATTNYTKPEFSRK